MNEIIPYKSLFYVKTVKNLVLHIFVDDTYNLHISHVREFDTELYLKEISKENLEYLITLSELNLHIPYIHLLLEQE